MRDLYTATEQRLATIIADGVEAGEIRSCEPLTVARTVINIIHRAPLGARRGLSVDARARTEAADTLNHMLIDGWASDRLAALDPPEIYLSPLLVRVADGFSQDALFRVRRETVLSCASRMFNSRGVDMTSLDELAAVLGTTKPRLYKYVGNKKTLVEECFSRADKINRCILESARNLSCGAMEKLVALLRTSAAVRLSGVLEPMRYSFADDHHGPIDQTLVTRRMLRMVEYNTQLFREGQELGVVKPFNLEGLRLVNMTGGGGIFRPAPEFSSTVSATAAEMVEVLRVGLSPL